MFAGIAAAVGRAEAVSPLSDNASAGVRLSIDAGGLPLADMALGGSIAIRGVCMVVVAKTDNRFEVDVPHELLSKTVGLEGPGEVNPEGTLHLADHIGGHLVSGHVDGLDAVTHSTPANESHELHMRTPAKLGKYLAYKGSVVVNGVSFMVSTVYDGVDGYEFLISLIPHIVAVTVFKRLKVGSQVNLEIDLIAYYVEHMLTRAAIGLPVGAQPLVTV